MHRIDQTDRIGQRIDRCCVLTAAGRSMFHSVPALLFILFWTMRCISLIWDGAGAVGGWCCGFVHGGRGGASTLPDPGFNTAHQPPLERPLQRRLPQTRALRQLRVEGGTQVLDLGESHPNVFNYPQLFVIGR